jgi:hypothetical protein
LASPASSSFTKALLALFFALAAFFFAAAFFLATAASLYFFLKSGSNCSRYLGTVPVADLKIS